jgi:hypothetical protein
MVRTQSNGQTTPNIGRVRRVAGAASGVRRAPWVESASLNSGQRLQNSGGCGPGTMSAMSGSGWPG